MKKFAFLPVAAMLATLLTSNGAALGQNLPPGPKLIFQSKVAGLTIPGEFSIIQRVNDFPAGAVAASHSHGGSGVGLVLDGELSYRVVGKPDATVKTGEAFAESPGDVISAVNTGSSTTRQSVVFALPKGAALTTPQQVANAQLADGQGTVVGSATLTSPASGPLRVQAKVSSFTAAAAGNHGIHVHAVGKCEGPKFTTAGGHFNPLGAQHGLENPSGPHAGDLPNIQFDASGNATFDASTDRLSMGSGPSTIFDADGSALVIHASPDDQKTDPSGNSGDRIACGVITAQKAPDPAPPSASLVFSSTLPGVSVQGEFDLLNLILEFAPGAATPLHTHGGPGIVTVLSGEMTNAMEDMPVQTIKTGESWPELPGQYAIVSNKGTVPARVSFAVALPKGAELTTVKAAPVPTAAPAPTVEPAPPPPAVEPPAAEPPPGMPKTGSSSTFEPLWVLVLTLMVALGLAVRSRSTVRK